MNKKILAALLVLSTLLVTSCATVTTHVKEATPLFGASSLVSTSESSSATQSESAAAKTTEESSTPETSLTTETSETTAESSTPTTEVATTAPEPTKTIENLSSHIFDEAAMFNPYGYAVVGEKKDGVMKYGMIGEDGNYVIQPEYDAYRTAKSEIMFYATELDNGYTWLQKDGLWGFVNDKCEWVLNPVYEDCSCFSSIGLAGFQKDGKWGFVSTDAKVVVEPTYDEVYMFERKDYVQVKKDGLWGLIDKTGNEVLAPLSSSHIATEGCYDERGYWEVEGDVELAVITTDQGLSQLITMDGRVIYEDTEYWRCYIENTRIFYGDSPKLGNGYFNIEGELMIPLADNEYGYDFSEGGIAVVVSTIDDVTSTCRFIDENGNTLFGREFEGAAPFDSNGLACVIVDGKYGFIDKTGAYVIEPIYDDADAYSYGSYIVVKLNGKAGLIDLKGTPMTEFVYDWIFSYSYYYDEQNSPIFEATKDGKTGLVDIHGKWVLDPEYTAIMPFQKICDEGWIMLCYSDNSYGMTLKDGKFGIISKQGKILIAEADDDEFIDIATNGYTTVKADGRFSYVDLDG